MEQSDSGTELSEEMAEILQQMDNPGADRLFRPEAMSLGWLALVGAVAAFGGALHGFLRSITSSSSQ